MALFGENDAKLLLYLKPLDSTTLANFAYDATARGELLDEKAEIVFSHFPKKYRRFYDSRVLRLQIVEFAKSGQLSVKAPFTTMTDIVGYLNPSEDIEDLKTATTVTVTLNAPNLEFSALAQGDKLIIDYTPDMSAETILSARWAVNVLSAIDIMSIIAGQIATGDLPERVMKDEMRVKPWLENLSNFENPEQRTIIKPLEHKFHDGKKNAMQIMEKRLGFSLLGTK